jgi:serine/threonine protein kinase
MLLVLLLQHSCLAQLLSQLHCIHHLLGDADAVLALQVRLVLEYCDRGSLREALDLGAFKLPDGSLNYPAVLDTGIEIATAVLHLHTKNVLHSDLKVGIHRFNSCLLLP